MGFGTLQGPRASDKKPEPTTQRTVSQSASTNMAKESTTVGHILASKGRKIFSIKPDDTIKTAVDVLREKRIGALVVCEEDGSLAGILSERDIVRKLSETPGQTLPQSVADNMTAKVETCTAEHSLVDVLRRMTDGKFRHMPIMEGNKVVGMLTIGDVVQHRLREVEHEALQLKQMVVG